MVKHNISAFQTEPVWFRCRMKLASNLSLLTKKKGQNFSEFDLQWMDCSGYPDVMLSGTRSLLKRPTASFLSGHGGSN